MNQTLMRAIIALAAFIELSDDETLDPDAATEQLDDLAGVLGQLTQAERDEFIAYTEQLAEELQQSAGSKEYLEFVSSFPESFGLRD